MVYDVRASYAVKDIVAKYGGTALMNRVGHAFFKTRMREEERDLRRRGDRALLLPRQFLRRQRLHPGAADAGADVAAGQTLRELLAPLRREVLHLRRDQHPRAATCASSRRRSTALAAKYQDGAVYSMDGMSVEYPDWHFNVRASNTEPMLRLNLEATTAELMEQKRDEVLAFIRSWR